MTNNDLINSMTMGQRQAIAFGEDLGRIYAVMGMMDSSEIELVRMIFEQYFPLGPEDSLEVKAHRQIQSALILMEEDAKTP